MSEPTQEEKDKLLVETALIAAFLVLVVTFGAGLLIGRYTAETPDCPAPTYDVDRVVKMHEETRKCEADLEEARDNVLVCGRLLKRALE